MGLVGFEGFEGWSVDKIQSAGAGTALAQSIFMKSNYISLSHVSTTIILDFLRNSLDALIKGD